jgi:hypothetical protein
MLGSRWLADLANRIDEVWKALTMLVVVSWDGEGCREGKVGGGDASNG